MNDKAVVQKKKFKLRAYKIQLIENITDFEHNSRTHSEDQIQETVNSINEFGYTNPILVDENNVIIAGHCRVMAAKICGMDEIPTIIIDGLSAAQKAALVIADNKMALNAGWDFTKLAHQITFLRDNDYNTDFTGFKADEIATFMPDEIPPFAGDEDDVPELAADPITKLGDIWILGKNRLMCGNSTMIDDVEKLMMGEKADMVFTDPPYGINVVSQGSFGDGKRHGKMAAHHNKYNDIINDDSIKTAQDSYNLCKSLQIEILIFWGANFYPSILEDGMSWLVWDKETCAPSFSDCEIAFVNKKGKLKIFKHQWSGMIRNSERGEKRTHPSQKPIALSEWCFDEYGKDAKSVLDLFGGSGSTLIASEKTNRKCFMMELSPSYVSVIIIRWMKFTGKMAYLLNDDGSQTSWDELNEERRKTS